MLPFSSPYGKERERAIKQTFQTIDFAERLGAPFIIMHLGEVSMHPTTDSFIKLARKGELLSRDYVRKKISAVEKREAASAAHIERVKDWFETNHRIRDDEKSEIWNRRPPRLRRNSERARAPGIARRIKFAAVRLLHDFGHIQIKENLAFLDHAEWLRQIGPRAFGCHVQDCIWPAQDHQPPFCG